MFSVILVILQSIFLGFGGESTPAPKKKPNIVLILADDLGWHDLGCYGNTYYETPNIDRLAAKGMRFTNAYAAAPVCSPSRVAILTGKHPARVRLTDFLVNNRKDTASPILSAAYIHRLPAEETTLAEALKQQGYVTGVAGKWHLGGSNKTENSDPRAQGFDFQRIISGGSTVYFYPQWLKTGHNEFTGAREGDYMTEKITEAGVEFIEANQDKPFFLYMPQFAVHIPLQARREKVEKYRSKPNPKPGLYDPTYAAMVESLDESVGAIVKKLEELKLLDNTIILFASDNGGLVIPEAGPQPTTNVPLREGKGHLYEGGIRIPLIMHWPQLIEAGRVSEGVVTNTDYFPTLMQLVAGEKKSATAVDGKSFLPLLKNKKFTRGPVYWHYPHFSNQGGRPSSAVRMGDYKLIEFYETGKVELYNLKEDTGETTDLSATLPDKTAALRKLLIEWRIEVDATMPGQNPAHQTQQP
jgi:arylsulfatase A